MAIILKDISERQKLIIAKGLLDYQFIMLNWKTNTKDFQDVYYEFYLKARWAMMKNPQNSKAYFDMLQSTDKKTNLMYVINELKSKLTKESYEFSLCSKLLHTINPQSPIYDSKVREYLSTEENVDFWFNTGKKNNKTTYEKIEHDWKELCSWYEEFLDSKEGKEWVDWFDFHFPSYSSISNYKKIDSIIFATN